MSKELFESIFADLEGGIAKEMKQPYGVSYSKAKKMNEITLKPFDESDWMAYSGAEASDKENAPAMIGEIEVTDWPAHDDEEEVEGCIVILDDNGVHVEDGTGYHATKPISDREIALATLAQLQSPTTVEELKEYGFQFPEDFNEAKKLKYKSKKTKKKMAKESFDELVAALQDAGISNKKRITKLHETFRKFVKEGRIPDYEKSPNDPEYMNALMEAAEEQSFMDKVIRDIKAAKSYYEEGATKVAYELLAGVQTQVSDIQSNISTGDAGSADVQVDAAVVAPVDAEVSVDDVDVSADASVDADLAVDEELPPVAEDKDPMLEEAKKKKSRKRFMKESDDSKIAPKAASANPDDHEEGSQDDPKAKMSGSAGIKDLPVGHQEDSTPEQKVGGTTGATDITPGAQDDPKKKDKDSVGVGSESKIKEEMGPTAAASVPSASGNAAGTVNYQVIASGISLKEVADKLAQDHKGQVKADDSDSKKFMVVAVAK